MESTSGQFHRRTEWRLTMDPIDRRRFLRVSGVSLGVGAFITVAPGMVGGGTASAMTRWFRRQNGETVSPFRLVQLSDAHVGFSGPPNPTGTKAIERTSALVKGLNPP